MAAKANVDNLAQIIASELGSYTKDVAAEINSAAAECANEMLNNIKADAPKHKGDYKKAMSIKTTKISQYCETYTWYVKTPYYRLTHLLEKGHLKKNGGRVKAYSHIDKNAKLAIQAFSERTERAIKNGGK